MELNRAPDSLGGTRRTTTRLHACRGWRWQREPLCCEGIHPTSGGPWRRQASATGRPTPTFADTHSVTVTPALPCEPDNAATTDAVPVPTPVTTVVSPMVVERETTRASPLVHSTGAHTPVRSTTALSVTTSPTLIRGLLGDTVTERTLHPVRTGLLHDASPATSAMSAGTTRAGCPRWPGSLPPLATRRSARCCSRLGLRHRRARRVIPSIVRSPHVSPTGIAPVGNIATGTNRRQLVQVPAAIASVASIRSPVPPALT